MKILLMALVLTFMLAMTPPSSSNVLRLQIAHVVFLLPEHEPRRRSTRRRRNHYVNRWSPY